MNALKVITITENDGRYVLTETSNKYKGNYTYYKGIAITKNDRILFYIKEIKK